MNNSKDHELDHSGHRVASLLRSVALKSGHNTFRLQPALMRRSSSNEPDNLLAKALKVDNADKESSHSKLVSAPCHDHIIEEEYLQDFLRWSNRQTIPMLPKVTLDCPLMPTSLTLTDVSLDQITKTIADCLHRLHDKNILFAYRAHPEHAGCIEISSTQCKLKFIIQLWQKQQAQPGNAPAAVVVELQRRRGCPIFMHHLKRPLFKALGALSKEPLKRTLSCPSLARNLDCLDAPHHGISSGELQDDLLLARRSCLEEPPVRFPPPLRVNFA